MGEVGIEQEPATRHSEDRKSSGTSATSGFPLSKDRRFVAPYGEPYGELSRLVLRIRNYASDLVRYFPLNRKRETIERDCIVSERLRRDSRHL